MTTWLGVRNARMFFLILVLVQWTGPSALALPSAIEEGEMCATRSIMALAWTICLYDTEKTPSELHDAIEMGMKEIHRIDEWMSEWKPRSLISQINDSAGIKPVKVTDEAWDAISESLHHSELTHGAFDITFNAFFGKYGWKKNHERFPTDEEIKKILPLVNYKKVIMDKEKKTVFLAKKGMKIGLGGMGEGWAIDKVFDLLKPLKIQSGFIDASGGTRFWGRKPNGKLWTVGVGNPRPKKSDDQSVLYKMYLTDYAVTTAGDTEKFFIRDGKRFHHIIDPKTGHSADRSIQVTAICKTATLCDLVDDGIFILGPEEGRKYAESQGVRAVIVDPQKKVTLTKGLTPTQTQWGPALEVVP